MMVFDNTSKSEIKLERISFFKLMDCFWKTL